MSKTIEERIELASKKHNIPANVIIGNVCGTASDSTNKTIAYTDEGFKPVSVLGESIKVNQAVDEALAVWEA